MLPFAPPTDPPAIVQVYAGIAMRDNDSWKATFANAVRWSTLGVKDDSGVTDNSTALNALPAGTPIIADCPNGGYVSFTETWFWQSNLTIWQDPNCWVKNTTSGVMGFFAIQNVGGTTAPGPITGVRYYGFQFGYTDPTLANLNAERTLEVWMDHSKVLYAKIKHTGGFAFVRGSDLEIGHVQMTETYGYLEKVAGNPGIRHFGNLPKVPTSYGMHANAWFHDLYFETGDADFQTCQPGTNTLTWLFNTSSDDVMYENAYGLSGGSAVILINEPVSDIDPAHTYTYTCTNIRYLKVSGIGHLGALVGNSNNLTSKVTISGGTISTPATDIGGTAVLPVIAVGKFKVGGTTPSNTNTNNVVINEDVSSFFQVAVGVANSSDVTYSGTISTPTVGVTSTAPTILISNSQRVAVVNSTVPAGNNLSAISDDAGSVGDTFTNNAITGVTNGKFGYALGNVTGDTILGGSVSPAAGATTATGLSLTIGASGTSNTVATGLDLSAMPAGFGVACAPGQGNHVLGNPGAADCP